MSAKKKYKVSLQKFQSGSEKGKPLPKPRAKNYDPLYDVKPQVSESTAVRNVPKQDKKVVQKAIAQKDAERKVVAQKIQANPLLTQAQKNEILMDPRKLDENINLAYEKGPDTLRAAKDYTTAERVENALRNPLVALSYAMKPGPFNMPMNYSEYERSPNYRDDVWDDNLVLKGANLISYLNPTGLALHTLDNAAYTATDIGKAIESGEFDDWKQAGLSAASTALDLVGARYIGGSGRLLNTGERATLEAMRTSNSLGLNPSINTFLGTRLMPRINSNVVRSAADLPQARLLPQINPNSVNYNPLARSIYNKAVTAGTAQNIAQGLSESGVGARSMSLDKFPFLNQVVGTVKNRNRESSLREAEKWFKEWVDSPYTQQKIEDSYRKITSGRQLSDTERHNLEEMIKFSSRYDPTGRLQEYPLLFQSLGKSNIHSNNIGVSYTHEHLPGDIKNVENTFRQKGSEEPLELVPEDHSLYGNWISRNITPEQRVSTGVHELNHDWIRDFTLKNTDLGKTLAGVIDKNQVQKVKDFYKSEGKLERAEKELEYITAPTEIYARLMEARRHFNLKPGQKITNNQASDYLDAIESGSTPIDQIFGTIIDRKKAADLFNNPWAWTGAATIGAASMQEQMYGGLFSYQDGGGKRALNPTNEEDLYSAGELEQVTVKDKMPDWARFQKEYQSIKPWEDYLAEEKRKYLRRSSKALNKMAGLSEENFPEDVEERFRQEYNQKMNTYATRKLGKKQGFNPRRRGEWVDELSPREFEMVAQSKYGSKLNPDVWSRFLSGAQGAANTLLPGQPVNFNIPGFTKREMQEARENPLEALELFAPIDVPGIAIANKLTNANIENPSIMSGETMANVNPYAAIGLNPLLVGDIYAIPSLAKGIYTGSKALGKGTANLYNKIATGNSSLPIAWKMEKPVANSLENKLRNLEDLQVAQKFAQQYGYELPSNLERIAQSDELTNRTIRGMVNRHNTFVRGVSTNWEEISRKNPEILRHLEGKGFDLSTEEGTKSAAEYMATHIPISTGYGRASLNKNVFDQGLEGLYTSNSIPTAEGYTYGQGYITSVRRPTDFSSPNRQDWISRNNPEYYEHNLPGGNSFLIDGKEISPLELEIGWLYNVNDYPDINIFKNKVLKDLEKNASELRDAFERNATTYPAYSKNIKKGYDRTVKRINEIKAQKWESMDLNFDKRLLKTEHDPRIRLDGEQDPYAHYIHLGTPGEKVLEPVKSWRITPEIWENTSRAHTNKYSKRFSAMSMGGMITPAVTSIDEESMQEQMYGGLFNYQSGGRKPIYTNDPTDPRIQNYRDSLKLHYQGLNEKNAYTRYLYKNNFDVKNHLAKWSTDGYVDTSKHPTIGATHYGILENSGGGYERKPDGTVKYFTYYPKASGVEEKVYDDTKKGKILKKRFSVYKKPVQPVYYKKAEEEKPQENKLSNKQKFNVSKSKPVGKVVPTPEPVPVQTKNTPPIKMPLRDKMILPLGRYYSNESSTGSLEGGKTTYGQFEKIVDPVSGKIRYIPTGKKSDFTTLQNPTFERGGEIIKDQEGQRKYPGKVTEIQGNLMATDGYGNIPLYVVPDVGEPKVIMPNTGTHEFKGATKFVEYPLISKKTPKKLSSKDFTSIKMKVEAEVEDHLNWIKENGYEEDKEEIDAMKKQLWKKYMPINTKL